MGKYLERHIERQLRTRACLSRCARCNSTELYCIHHEAHAYVMEEEPLSLHAANDGDVDEEDEDGVIEPSAGVPLARGKSSKALSRAGLLGLRPRLTLSMLIPSSLVFLYDKCLLEILYGIFPCFIKNKKNEKPKKEKKERKGKKKCNRFSDNR